MKKIIFLSFVVASVLFTAYAEEAKTVEKVPANKIEAEKPAAPLLSPKKPKPAECVAPAKPASMVSSWRRLSFKAVDLITVSPNVTWPSPPIATLPFRLTPIIVVDRNFLFFKILNLTLIIFIYVC